jgi:hypothetical protein
MWILGGWTQAQLFNDVWYAEGLGGVENGHPLPLPDGCGFDHLRPNPFRNAVGISYHLSHPGTARLTIRSKTGAEIRTWTDRHQSAGRHELCWDGKDDAGQPVTAGVYFMSLESESFSVTEKITRLE